jgi:hypothetical protein
MPARKPPSDNRVVIRVTPQVRQRLEREARKNRCTLNREMANRLEASLSAVPLRSIEDVANDLTAAWAKVRKGAGKAA